MEVTWIEHNGRKVLFSNYEGCKTSEEMIGILYKEAEILMGQEGKVLVIFSSCCCACCLIKF